MHVRAASTIGGCSRLHLSIFFSLFVRHASTSSKQSFPFPSCANPTPHEIFHLPRNASQDEIKSRYYELVKVYHPDAIPNGQHDVSPSRRNAQFRAITHAYGILRGRDSGSARNYREFHDEIILAELRRRSRRSRSSSSTSTAPGSIRSDDTQIRYTLIAFVFAGMVAAMGSISSHMDRVERHSRSAAANLTLARAEAQVYGMERRRRIRERVRAYHEEGEIANGSEIDDTLKVWQSEPSCREAGLKLPDR